VVGGWERERGERGKNPHFQIASCSCSFSFSFSPFFLSFLVAVKQPVLHVVKKDDEVGLERYASPIISVSLECGINVSAAFFHLWVFLSLSLPPPLSKIIDTYHKMLFNNALIWNGSVRKPTRSHFFIILLSLLLSRFFGFSSSVINHHFMR
jgi:hypothetical protein